MTSTTMLAPTSRNKAIIRRLYQEHINTGKLDQLGELVSDDYVGPQGERGPAGFASTVAGLRSGFPDVHFTLDDLLAEGDRVTVRWTWTGTHEHPFRGHAPSHKQLSNTAIAIYEIKDAKVTRVWMQTDRLGFLQQVGAVPKGLGGPAAASAPSP